MEETPTITAVELRAMHPADLADHLEQLSPEAARELLKQIPREQLASAISELEEDQLSRFLSLFSNTELAEILRNLPHDAAADIAGRLSPESCHEVLAWLKPDEAGPITSLLHYDADTAGGIMTDHFLALRADDTLEEAMAKLRQQRQEQDDENIEEVAYLFVTDDEQKLVGVVSLRDMVFRRPHRKVREIMDPNVQSVWVDDDQEKIAQAFDHYHYMALPVLERDGRLVGMVVANKVIDVLQQEATEDMQLMVGLSGEESARTPWRESVVKRLPWLYVNLLTAFLAAAVVGLFESTIAKWTVLAVFLPIVAGQGGNAGVQTLTVIIRAMALGEIMPGEGRRALVKEALVGLMNGLAIGVVVGIVGWLWKGSALLGAVVAVAMVLNMFAAALSGVLVPYGLKAFRIDPALASSIFVTTVTDVAGFFFFLGLAALGLHWFG